jgi:hypothetical protein
MKKPKFKYIPQKMKDETQSDCAIACIAMILGCSYNAVYEDMYDDFEKNGVSFKRALEYLADHGLSVITKEWKCYQDIRKNNKRMKEPFADIHLVRVRQYANKSMLHSMVMDKNGRVYDPSPFGRSNKGFAGWYEILEVGGCYYS